MTDDPQRSSAARAAITDEANTIVVRATTAWEIAAKQRLGKLDEAAGACKRFTELAAADGFDLLAIDTSHALEAGPLMPSSPQPPAASVISRASSGLTVVIASAKTRPDMETTVTAPAAAATRIRIKRPRSHETSWLAWAKLMAGVRKSFHSSPIAMPEPAKFAMVLAGLVGCGWSLA